MIRLADIGTSDHTALAVAFTLAHARTMLRYKIVSTMISLGVEPDEAIISEMVRVAWPGLQLTLKGDEPDLAYGSSTPGTPIDWLIEAKVKELCCK